VALLVQRRDFPVDIRDLFGWTALHVAAFEDHADSAIGLLENGADVNAETTAIAGKQRGADHPPSWLWKVDPGSRPLDTHRPPLRSGSAKNTAAILRQYGATENPAVDNTLR
jgi:ankyrin repeat protein